MSTIDERGIDERGIDELYRLTREAIASQEPAVADQLSAALRDGHHRWWAEERPGTAVLVVEVLGHRVCEVDVRRLVPLDDLL